MYTYMHACIHTYTHTHRHTYLCIQCNPVSSNLSGVGKKARINRYSRQLRFDL